VDETVGWADPAGGGVPIVTHLHGAEVQSLYDGHPEAWFTPQGETGPSYSGQNYTYPNDQPPAALWYHDHTIGITRLNVAAGLAGMYIIRSDEEDRAGLPLGLPLVLHDRQFYADGSLNFPTLGIIPDLHPQWCPEYYGDTILVNGVAWPRARVLRRAYRFRVLNACSARFFVLSLSDPALTFSQIGTDGGFAGDGPWSLSSITMAPSERADVIVDFSALRPGDTVVLNNSGPTPFPSGDKPEVGGPPGTTAVLEFVVVDDDGDEEGIADGIVEEAHLPVDLGSLVDRDEAPLLEENVAVTRSLSVVEYDDGNHMPMQFTLENRTWADPWR
jgi:FtsP/CotA-like multicopper oxidase with cupredoxin domain